MDKLDPSAASPVRLKSWYVFYHTGLFVLLTDISVYYITSLSL